MKIPENFAERVYAGVLGKIIGVYLGRPFEGWTYDQIINKFGEIRYFVNSRTERNKRLVVTDDDISGTFTFLRALEDYSNSQEITAYEIGQSWLNYIIENRTILWWGGFGNSTEHTAYVRLKNGIKAPGSGSIALNGKNIAEQIGAQIFIDGWAMAAPGNPELAVNLAGKAASVSHDGEAIYASKVLAAMESQAFVEQDIKKLIDLGVSFIPKDSIIYRLISDIREWYAAEPDWHQGRKKLVSLYNYENYGGNCHIVPNHGLIILGLIYGEGDFNKSMSIVNTAGWDTDCNSGNLGCLLGIKNGLAAFDQGKDWRGPVADRLYLPSADGGRSITDAVIETIHIVNMARNFIGEESISPKEGARFNFNFPGSVQGFRAGEESTIVKNVPGHSRKGFRSLGINFIQKGSVSTPTFILPTELDMEGYELIASPTLYTGQSVLAGVTADQDTRIKLFIKIYNRDGKLEIKYGPETTIKTGDYIVLEWIIPPTAGQPIAEIGLAFEGNTGRILLDSLTWTGEPDVLLTRPTEAVQSDHPSMIWRRAWVKAIDIWEPNWPEPYRLVQNEGRGMIIQGTREWKNYIVEADISPWLMCAGGIAARVQGLRRFYTFQLITGDKIRVTKALDGDKVLGEKGYKWTLNRSYKLRLFVSGNQIIAWVNGERQFEIIDEESPLLNGGVAYVVEQGHISSQAMKVSPILSKHEHA